MMKTLPLSSRAETTALKQPKELFSFARLADGLWNTDEEKSKQESLPYYYLPDAYVDRNIDLAGGYKNFNRIPEEQNRANFPVFLQAIQQYEQKTGKKMKGDIVTFRGIMTKLLALPYDLKQSFQLYIVPYDGQLFIKNDDEFGQQNEERDEYLQKCEYSGYKFETVATLPKPWAECSRTSIEKRHKKPVSNYEQYISVVRTGIGKVRTVLAGEVDCVWDYIPEEEEDILQHYVELKTSKTIENNGQALTFEKKLYKTWCQCFLLGIKRVVYGFRDKNLILRDVEVFNTDEIPILLKDTTLPKQGAQIMSCVNGLKWYGAVLDWLKKNIDANDDLKTYKVTYDSGSRTFSLAECMGDENKTLRNGGLLTEEFKTWRSSIRN